MDIAAILIGLAALILVAFFVSQPLVDWREGREKTLSEADRLSDQRDRILATLRDLDFDHAGGKVLEEDYAPLRAKLVAEGAAVLKQLDELKPAASAQLESDLEQAIAAHRHGHAPAPTGEAAGAAPADAIEQAVAARRRRPAPDAARRADTAPAEAAAVDIADAVEQAIAARRKRRPAADAGGEKRYCSQCGQAALPGDKFCARCGAPLHGAPSTKDSA